MKTDAEIQRAIGEELRARRDEGSSDLSATVHQGVVRLSGTAGSYCEKYAAEQAARAIPGVAQVINEIETRVARAASPPDHDLRCEVLRALQTEVPSIFDRLSVEVRDGAVTMSGVVGCHFLRERADSAVRRLGSIVTVHNAIQLEPAVLVAEVLRRVPGMGIDASARNGEITLSGTVESDEVRALAERAAWSVPCVASVRNELEIRPSPRGSIA